jgi:hypothetical protein
LPRKKVKLGDLVGRRLPRMAVFLPSGRSSVGGSC